MQTKTCRRSDGSLTLWAISDGEEKEEEAEEARRVLYCPIGIALPVGGLRLP